MLQLYYIAIARCMHSFFHVPSRFGIHSHMHAGSGIGTNSYIAMYICSLYGLKVHVLHSIGSLYTLNTDIS